MQVWQITKTLLEDVCINRSKEENPARLFGILYVGTGADELCVLPCDNLLINEKLLFHVPRQSAGKRADQSDNKLPQTPLFLALGTSVLFRTFQAAFVKFQIIICSRDATREREDAGSSCPTYQVMRLKISNLHFAISSHQASRWYIVHFVIQVHHQKIAGFPFRASSSVPVIGSPQRSRTF